MDSDRREVLRESKEVLQSKKNLWKTTLGIPGSWSLARTISRDLRWTRPIIERVNCSRARIRLHMDHPNARWKRNSCFSTLRTQRETGHLLEDDLGVPLDHLSPSSFHSLSLCRMISSWISSIYRSLLSRCSLLFGALFDPYKYSHSSRAR